MLSRSVALQLIIFFALTVTWLPITGPFQLLSYFGPILVVALLLVTNTGYLVLSELLILLSVYILGTTSAFLLSDTGIINPALGTLTYSSLLLLAIRVRIRSLSIINDFTSAVALCSLLEFIIGFLQLVTNQGGSLTFTGMSAGDWVVGTLQTNSHLFAVKMLFQGLLLIYMWWHIYTQEGINNRLWLSGGISSFLGALAASAMAATSIFIFSIIFFLILSAVVKFLLGKPFTILNRVPIRQMFLYLGTALCAIALVVSFVAMQPRNTQNLVGTLQVVTRLDFSNQTRFQKIHVFSQSLTEILFDNAKNATIGLGLGRYSSRAAMILSGGYLRFHPSWIPISRSFETNKYIYPLWNQDIWPSYGGSIMSMPTNSLQSIIIEFGLLGTILYLFYFAKRIVFVLWNGISKENDKNSINPFMKLVPLLIFCFLTVSVTDLWFEYASLTGFIYLVVVLGTSSIEPPSQLHGITQ